MEELGMQEEWTMVMNHLRVHKTKIIMINNKLVTIIVIYKSSETFI